MSPRKCWPSRLMSYGRSKRGGANWNGLGIGMASPKAKLGCVVTRTASNRATLPGDEQELGAIRRPYRMVTIVGVLGDLILRARRRKRLHVDRARWASLRGGIRHPSAVRRKHRAGQMSWPATRPHRSGRPFCLSTKTPRERSPHPCRRCTGSARHHGAHDSGMCETPSSAFVSRSAVPVPSARCQKMPRSPSRSDWNATRWLSADQTGNRLCPVLEREPSHRARPGQLVDPDDGLFAVVAARRRCACRRATCEAVGRRPAGASAAPIRPLRSNRREVSLSRRRRDGTWNVHERPGAGDAELRPCCQ